jgi:hypothetical protein
VNKIQLLWASALLFSGVACAVGSLFSETLITSVPLVIASLFLFAWGWNKLSDIRSAAVLKGILEWPQLSFSVKRDPRVELVDQGGKVHEVTRAHQDGAFTFQIVPDGVWVVRASSEWMVPIEKRVEVHRRQKVDLGVLRLEFDLGRIWQSQTVPQISQIVDASIVSDGSIWAVGFHTSERSRNSRKIMCYKPGGSWKEVVIPHLAQGERACSIRELSRGRIMVGSLGAGAAISSDLGATWENVATPNGIDSVLGIVELPDGSLVVLGWEWCCGRPKRSVVLKYTDDATVEPRICLSLADVQFTSLTVTEPGRVILTGLSWSQAGGILISEDFGESWVEPPIRDRSGGGSEPLFGVSTCCELSDIILAGTLCGRGDRFKSIEYGEILSSRSGGLDWEKNGIGHKFGDIVGFCRVDEGTVVMMAMAGKVKGALMLLISTDHGVSWTEFIELPVAGPTAKLREFGEKCVAHAMNKILIADKSELRPDRFT